MTYNEQYVVMPFIALVGVVGGNLGLFIDFNFIGTVSSLLLFISDKTLNFKHKGNNCVLSLKRPVY